MTTLEEALKEIEILKTDCIERYSALDDVNIKLNEEVQRLKAERAKLIESFTFTLCWAENMLRPDKPVRKGFGPTMYHTLTYEGDVELIERCKRARTVLTELESK